MDLLLFIAVSIGIIIIPGPNVLVIISTSLTSGRWQGLKTVAGTSSAMAIQLLVAALSTSWFIEQLASGFFWLKWLGIAYLAYLAATHFIKAMDKSPPQAPAPFASFKKGFWVSLTNPKTILFFSAFLPQFIDPAKPFLAQISLLSLIFLLLATILDSSYALLADKVSNKVKTMPLSLGHYVSGVLYLGAGFLVATSRKSQ